MTLTTRFRILDPHDVQEVWRQAERTVGAEPGHARYSEVVAGVQFRMVEPEQGLPAWVRMTNGIDGPLPPYEDEPQGCFSITWDTAYERDNDPAAVHAEYVAMMGAWCDEHRLRWTWCDDFSDWRACERVVLPQLLARR